MYAHKIERNIRMMKLAVLLLSSLLSLTGYCTSSINAARMGDLDVNPSKKKHFVFVHGASHGSWCWYKVRTMLEGSGHRVTCIDLTGAGIDLTDPNTVLAFNYYNKPLFSFLSELPQHEKVVLVGHSAGGGSVTEALCKFTDKISVAVYIGADMYRPGTRPTYSGGSKDVGESIWEYTYGQGRDQPPTSIIMKNHFRREAYYNQSPVEDWTLASMLIRPAPFLALRGANQLPPNPEAEKVPRVYMKTAKDQLFDPPKQDSQVRQWPPDQIFVLEGSDHSAFFSVPETVSAYLVQAASSL